MQRPDAFKEACPWQVKLAKGPWEWMLALLIQPFCMHYTTIFTYNAWAYFENLSIDILFLYACTELLCFQFCSIIVGWRQQTDFFYMWHRERFLRKIWRRKPSPIIIYMFVLCFLLYACSFPAHRPLRCCIFWPARFSREGWEDTQNQRLAESTRRFQAIYCSSGWPSVQEKEYLMAHEFGALQHRYLKKKITLNEEE